ncbi:MAG: hypothetical protein ACK4JB_20080 [Reyranella sp.]
MSAGLPPGRPADLPKPPLADAEVVERMREPHFRIGWMMFELEMAAAELGRAAEHVKADFRRRSIVERSQSIERTLRLCREAADASEKVLPVKPDATVAS